jgi:hypothetical protein
MLARLSAIFQFAAVLCVLGHSGTAIAASPFDDAKTDWRMSDALNTAAKGGALAVNGNVRLGVELTGAEREASLLRGGDGRVAQFQGGYIVAGGKGGDDLRITGKHMSLYIRVRDPQGKWNAPLLSHFAPDDKLADLLYGSDTANLQMGFRETKRGAGGRSLKFQWRTSPWEDRVRPEILNTSEKFRTDRPDYRNGILRVAAPMDLVGPCDWHDVIVRFRDANLELFVDGVLVDEEWPHGGLYRFEGPLLIGASVKDGKPVAGFNGMVDHLAIWNRALTDDEIQRLSGGKEQVAKRAIEILGPESPTPQYWRPRGPNAWIGDCMPFYHDGTFHFYYLFDRRHSQSKWEMGAHQFGHASSKDLVHWDYHPLALPITAQTEASLGTGLCVFHDAKYHMFYIPHNRRGYFKDSPWLGDTIGVATSVDGIHFTKSATPCVSLDYRTGGDINPNVVYDAAGKRFVMVIDRRRFVSTNLADWKETKEFQNIPPWCCASYFDWNQWHYYTAWQMVQKSRQPIGSAAWQGAAGLGDALFCPQVAEFTGNRRLLVGFVDDGQWGSYAAFRELVQHPNGDLGTKWVAEMIPPAGEKASLPMVRVEGKATANDGKVRLDAKTAPAAAALTDMPQNARITLRIRPEAGVKEFGLVVRSSGKAGRGMELKVVPAEKAIKFNLVPAASMPAGAVRSLRNVDGLAETSTIDLIVKDDLLDVCVNDNRTFIVRIPSGGQQLGFFARGGAVTFDDIVIRPLLQK